MSDVRTIPLELLERVIEVCKGLLSHCSANWLQSAEWNEHDQKVIEELEGAVASGASPTMLEIAQEHQQASQIIATALAECSHPSLKPEDHQGNAVAILARLAHTGFVLEKCKEVTNG